MLKFALGLYLLVQVAGLAPNLSFLQSLIRNYGTALVLLNIVLIIFFAYRTIRRKSVGALTIAVFLIALSYPYGQSISDNYFTDKNKENSSDSEPQRAENIQVEFVVQHQSPADVKEPPAMHTVQILPATEKRNDTGLVQREVSDSPWQLVYNSSDQKYLEEIKLDFFRAQLPLSRQAFYANKTECRSHATYAKTKRRAYLFIVENEVSMHNSCSVWFNKLRDNRTLRFKYEGQEYLIQHSKNLSVSLSRL